MTLMVRDVEVVTIGEVLAVLLAEPGLPLGEAGTYTATYAGAEANVAVGLARLGHPTALVSRLGDDAFGRRVRRELRGEGVDVTGIALDPARPTGLLLRDSLAGRPVSVAYHRAGSAATALSPDDVDAQQVRAARVLHLTGITPALSSSADAACRRAAEIAHEAGVRVSFDPNVRLRLADPARWREIADSYAALADVVLVGVDDAAALGVDDPIVWAHQAGARHVVVKDGARGARESVDGEVHSQPAITVPVVDTVGAGDAFAVGWLSALLRGVPAPQRLAEGAAVAACVVATRGDIPGLPDAATRDAVLAGTEAASR